MDSDGAMISFRFKAKQVETTPKTKPAFYGKSVVELINEDIFKLAKLENIQDIKDTMPKWKNLDGTTYQP